MLYVKKNKKKTQKTKTQAESLISPSDPLSLPVSDLKSQWDKKAQCPDATNHWCTNAGTDAEIFWGLMGFICNFSCCDVLKSFTSVRSVMVTNPAGCGRDSSERLSVSDGARCWFSLVFFVCFIHTRPAAFCTRWEEPCQEKLFFNSFCKPAWHCELLSWVRVVFY